MYPSPVSETLPKTQKGLQLSLFQPPPAPAGQAADPLVLKYRNLLSPLLPDPGLPLVISWFTRHQIGLRITGGRSSKSGDFRPPRNGSLPLITINGTLNQYAFLITLIHEMAHFHVYREEAQRHLLKRKRRIPPHGERWKEEFRGLMAPYLIPEIFPEPVLTCLRHHMQRPRAATHTDPSLARALLRYDAAHEGILIEGLPEGSLFSTSSGMLFRKEGKLRKRYRCTRVTDRRAYLFSPLARVFPAGR